MAILRSMASGRVDGQDNAPQLRLYIAGSSPRSLNAVQNVKRICDSEFAGQYSLEVVDIYQEPRRASEDRVVAIPTLIKRVPGLVRRLTGEMSETTLLGFIGAVLPT